MSWEAIGALGEAFSALGLFFVLVQVRHARAEMKRSIAHADVDTNLRSFYRARPVSRLWYETNKVTLNREAVQYIDNLLAQPA